MKTDAKDQKIIEVRNVSFAYPNQSTTAGESPKVLDHISFTVETGAFVGIIGRNGSGKSTLAKLLNGILLPTEGEIIINGMNTADAAKIWDIRRTAGMVFQNPDNQLVATIVEDDVAFGPENLGIPSEEIRRRVDQSLAAVNMGGFRGKKPHQLSGGQKQRVAIAGILAMAPECIIFDETTAMLDPQGRDEVIETIQKLNRDRGMTILYITHYMEELIHADHIMVLDEGKIVLEGTPTNVFSEIETLHGLHLNVPPMTQLGAILNQKGCPLPPGILSVPEMVSALEKVLPPSEDCEGVIPPNPSFSLKSQSPEDPSLLRIENLGHVYSKGSPFEHRALKGINAEIYPGEFIGIIGHTGCGKTTLIQHLNGLLKPTEGHVFLEDRKIFSLGKKGLIHVRREVGLVFQYPEHQLFEETVAKDVAFGPMKAGLSEEEIEERVRWALNMVGLDVERVKDQSPFSLSGGQMRRVAIAGILAMKPKVLILDEPTAGLDPLGREEILSRIDRLHREEKMTVVLISHSMEDVSCLADRIMVMHQGELVCFETPDAVFAKGSILKEIGLGLPAISLLFSQLKARHYPVRENIFSLSSAVEAIMDLFGHRKEDRNV